MMLGAAHFGRTPSSREKEYMRNWLASTILAGLCRLSWPVKRRRKNRRVDGFLQLVVEARQEIAWAISLGRKNRRAFRLQAKVAPPAPGMPGETLAPPPPPAGSIPAA